MKRFDIPLVAEGLTAYAIERQNGWERHRPEGAPTWAERRCFWTDAILQGMTKLEGQDPDPKWLRQFDRRLTDRRSGLALTTEGDHPKSAKFRIRAGDRRR